MKAKPYPALLGHAGHALEQLPVRLVGAVVDEFLEHVDLDRTAQVHVVPQCRAVRRRTRERVLLRARDRFCNRAIVFQFFYFRLSTGTGMTDFCKPAFWAFVIGYRELRIHAHNEGFVCSL